MSIYTIPQRHNSWGIAIGFCFSKALTTTVSDSITQYLNSDHVVPGFLPFFHGQLMRRTNNTPAFMRHSVKTTREIVIEQELLVAHAHPLDSGYERAITVSTRT